jgi:hypothetical protein
LISALTLTEVKAMAAMPPGRFSTCMRQRKVIYLMASAMLMTAAHGALYVFYSIHLVNQGYGKTLVGLLWTLGVVAEIFIFLLDAADFAAFQPARHPARLLCASCVAFPDDRLGGGLHRGFWYLRSYCTQ